MEDVSTYPKLVEELLRRGYSNEEASKVVGRNLITAMERMEKVNKLAVFLTISVAIFMG